MRRKCLLFLVLPALALLAARVAAAAWMPVFDPSEARYATLAANMARSGDFVRPAFFHHGVYQTFAGKPPLSFQMGALACRAFGVGDFAVRLPSLLCAAGVLALLWWAARPRGGRARAVLLCVGMPGFLAFAGLCMTDMPLTFAVVGMLAVLARGIRTGWSWPLATLWGLFAGAGLLIKGPVALALGGGPFALWCLLNGLPRGLTRWHVWWMGGLCLGLAAPWFALMEAREPGSFAYFLLNENIGRFLTQDYGDRYGSGHKFFHGVSVPWLLALTAPWGLWFLRRRVWRGFRGNLPALATAWVVVFWALTPRVPLAYLLPAVPLAAWWLGSRRVSLRRFPLWAGAELAVLAAVAVLVPLVRPDKLPGRFFRSLPPSATVSFAGEAPYSAEFVLGDRVRRDGSGDVFLLRDRERRRWAVLRAPGEAGE